jgi:hypothetical protein
MKKAIISIAFACYLVVTSGVIVNFHYCMNRLASTELFAGASKECGKCGMQVDKPHGCCHDEIRIVKMAGDQKVNSAMAFNLPAMKVSFQTPSEFLLSPFMNGTAGPVPADHAPPYHLPKENTYLLNGVFRI